MVVKLVIKTRMMFVLKSMIMLVMKMIMKLHDYDYD